MRPARPAAASVWPQLVFADPTKSGRSAGRSLTRHRRDRFQFDGIARARTRAMRFHIADPRGRNSRILIGDAQDLFLTLLARRPHRTAAASIIADRASPG